MPVSEAPLSMLLPVWLLVVAMVYVGFDAEWTAGLAQRAAAELLEGSVAAPDALHTASSGGLP